MKDNIVLEKDEALLRRKRILAKILSLSLAMTIAAAGGFMFAKNMGLSSEVSLELSPIINQQAREAYENGFITKASAVAKIDAHLNSLQDNGNIESWDYVDIYSRYDVILTNGTKFTYYLD